MVANNETQIKNQITRWDGLKNKINNNYTLSLGMTIVFTHLKMMVIFMGVLSIYWGAFYKRENRQHNLNSLLINLDTPVQINGEDVGIGKTFVDMVTDNDYLKSISRFEIVESIDGENASAYAQSLIYHEKYWGVYVINPGTTELLQSSLVNNNITNIPIISKSINQYYQVGRHYTGMRQFYVKNSYRVSQTWINSYVYTVYNSLIGDLSNESKISILSSNTSTEIITVKPFINVVDIGGTPEPETVGPSEIGLVYAVLFTIYQYTFNVKSYMLLESRLTWRRYLLFRIIATQINALLLGLLYGLCSIALQNNVRAAFGYAGFMVLWATMYLFFVIFGYTMEIGFEIVAITGKFYLLCPWIIFIIMINIATTFYPIEVAPHFYRFGYALPMYNTFEILRVVFFNTNKSSLGRNYGILVAWVFVCLLASVGIKIILKRKGPAQLH